MIKTKDLEEFIEEGETRTIYCNVEVEKEVGREYKYEIIKRLRERDELKKKIVALRKSGNE